MTINEELYSDEAENLPITYPGNEILERCRSVMINNDVWLVDLNLSQDPSTSCSSLEEVDDSRMLKCNLIRGSESRKILKIPIQSHKTLDVSEKKSRREECKRVGEFRKTMLVESSVEEGGDDSWRKSMDRVTWDKSLEFQDHNNEARTSAVEVGEDVRPEWYDVFSRSCKKRRIDEERYGYSPAEFDEHDLLIEPVPRLDDLSLPV